MRAAVDEWAIRRPDVAISLGVRPLAAFNDQPLEEVAVSADLLFVDHPMMGMSAASEALTPLDTLLPVDQLESLASDSIGASHGSYFWGGHQWATAVDAACQVAVWQTDRLADFDAEPPETWEDVLALAQSPGCVALPLYPSDAYLSLLSIAATLRPAAPVTAELIDEESVAILRELVSLVRKDCFSWNPPALLDLMSSQSTDAPAYCPLTFGYSTYQRPAATGRRLTFGDVPDGPTGRGRSVLGGAGLAVSAGSKHPSDAADFAAWVAGAGAQREVVLPNGGQPASRGAWLDPQADGLVGGFFSGTRRTLEEAVVRPREQWWPRFQEQAGTRLVDLLRSHATEAQIIAALNTLSHDEWKEMP